MDSEVTAFEVLKMIVQWGVIPVVGFVWLIYKTQQNHQTELAVLRALQAANKETHDREFKEMRENFKTVFAKLDSIEQSLRN